MNEYEVVGRFACHGIEIVIIRMGDVTHVMPTDDWKKCGADCIMRDGKKKNQVRIKKVRSEKRLRRGKRIISWSDRRIKQ